jgi:hypothetical protein
MSSPAIGVDLLSTPGLVLTNIYTGDRDFPPASKKRHDLWDSLAVVRVYTQLHRVNSDETQEIFNAAKIARVREFAASVPDRFDRGILLCANDFSQARTAGAQPLPATRRRQHRNKPARPFQ